MAVSTLSALAHGGSYNAATDTVVSVRNGNTDVLTTISTGGITRSVTSVSSNTNAGSAAGTDYVYIASNAAILTLPTAVGNTNQYTLQNSDGSACGYATTSGQTINGSTTASVRINGMALSVTSNGANWVIV